MVNSEVSIGAVAAMQVGTPQAEVQQTQQAAVDAQQANLRAEQAQPKVDAASESGTSQEAVAGVTPEQKEYDDIQALEKTKIGDLSPQATESLLFFLSGSTQVRLEAQRTGSESYSSKKLQKEYGDALKQVDTLMQSVNPMQKALGYDIKIALRTTEARTVSVQLQAYRREMTAQIRAEQPDLTGPALKQAIDQALAANDNYRNAASELYSHQQDLQKLKTERQGFRSDGQPIADQAKGTIKMLAETVNGGPLDTAILTRINNDPMKFGTEMMKHMANNPKEYNAFSKKLLEAGLVTKDQLKGFKDIIDTDKGRNVRTAASWALLMSILSAMVVKNLAEEEMGGGGGQRR